MPEERKSKLTDEQRTLVETNIGLARMVAWRYRESCKRCGMDWDDAFSIACLGLVKAARSFDRECGSPSAYLTRGCELAILMELRKCRNLAHSAFATVSVEDCHWRNLKGEQDLTIADTLASDEPTPEEMVVNQGSEEQFFAEIKKRITPRQYQILRLRMKGLTQRQIAEMLGCTQSIISRQLAKCRKPVQEVLAS